MKGEWHPVNVNVVDKKKKWHPSDANMKMTTGANGLVILARKYYQHKEDGTIDAKKLP